MIPVCEPTLNGKELEYATECIKTNWISSNGKYIKEFEEEFAEYCGTKHGIACSNGTIAVHLALAALGISREDEVIVPTFTMIGSVNPVIYCGATPVFVDAEPDTWNINVSKLEEKITKKTKAILPVHIYGHPVDMDPLLELADKYKLTVIEDAAEAHGAEYKGKKVGSLGDMGCFSFYANKIITTGEGGMVVTNNDQLASRLRLLKDQAYGTPRFIHHEVGFNYRMTNIQAAIGLAQLEQIDTFIEARRDHAHKYNAQLKNVKGITLPTEKDWAKNVYWMYGILIEDSFGISKNETMKKLKDLGIDTRSFFLPMHQQPVYTKMGIPCETLPISEELFKKGLYLPSSSSLTDEQINTVVEGIKAVKK
ncbi:MAG: DegT/DnrJ/EryC1/StrS family aminotransferase [archaeon]